MFNRKTLALSILVTSSLVTGAAFAQQTDRAIRDASALGQRGDQRGELPGGNKGAPRQTARRIISRADTNDDQQINLDEFLAERAMQTVRQFDHRDSDGDGLLSGTDTGPRHRALNPEIDIAEFRACIAENGSNPELEEDPFTSSDTNADGAVSKDEFYAFQESRATAQFARIDADSNGQLTTEEIKGNMQDGKEHREIVRQCLSDARDPLL